jgi:hypothetical protein
LGGPLLGQELERDTLVELEVARLDDDPHPALTEQAIDAVFPGQDGAGSDLGAGLGRGHSAAGIMRTGRSARQALRSPVGNRF